MQSSERIKFMSLKSKLKNEIKKGNLGKSVDYIPMYPTGIDVLDYVNGMVRYDGTIGLGIPAGKIFMSIGNSGSGKSSMVIKLACAIADQFEETTIIHYDYERSTTKERVMAISGWDSVTYDDRYEILQKDISAESLYEACKKIEEIKYKDKETRESIQFSSGMKDKYGNEIYELPPTVIIVDSVALLAPKEMESDDELSGSMGATAIAKTNTNIFKRIMEI